MPAAHNLQSATESCAAAVLCFGEDKYVPPGQSKQALLPATEHWPLALPRMT